MEVAGSNGAQLMQRWIHEEFNYISHKREVGTSDLNEEKRIRQELQIPEFNGTNVADWILQMEDIFHFFQLNETERIMFVAMSLVDEALWWFEWEHRRRPFYEWQELKDVVARRFGSSSREVQSDLTQSDGIEDDIEDGGAGRYTFASRDILAGSQFGCGYSGFAGKSYEGGGIGFSVAGVNEGVGKFPERSRTFCRFSHTSESQKQLMEETMKKVESGGGLHRLPQLSGRGRFVKGGSEASGSGGGPGVTADREEGMRKAECGGGHSALAGGSGAGGGPADFVGGNSRGGCGACEGDKYGGGNVGSNGYVEVGAEGVGSAGGGSDGDGKVVTRGSGGVEVEIEGGSKIGVEGQNILEGGRIKDGLTGSWVSLHKKQMLEGASKGKIGSHFKSDLRRGDSLLESRAIDWQWINIDSQISNSTSKVGDTIPISSTQLNGKAERNGPLFFEPNLSYFSNPNISTQSGSPQKFQPNSLIHSSQPMSNVTNSLSISQTQILQPTLPISTAQSTVHTSFLYLQFSQLLKPNCTYHNQKNLTIATPHKLAMSLTGEELARQWKPGIKHNNDQHPKGREVSANYFPP